MIDVKLEPKFHFIVNILKDGSIRISYISSEKKVALEIIEWFKSNQIDAYKTDGCFIVVRAEHFDSNEITQPLDELFKSQGLKASYVWQS